jgi:hypothetical protein
MAGGRDFIPHVMSSSYCDEDVKRVRRALRIWHDARGGADTIVRRYLATRGGPLTCAFTRDVHNLKMTRAISVRHCQQW